MQRNKETKFFLFVFYFLRIGNYNIKHRGSYRASLDIDTVCDSENLEIMYVNFWPLNEAEL